MNIEKQVSNDIAKAKATLIKKCHTKGAYENFGQDQVRKLNDKYFDQTYARNTVSGQIQSFNEWCMSYSG